MTFLRSSPRPERAILDLPSVQRKIIIACWVSYAIYYLGRLNLSAALTVFEDDRGLTGAQTGLIFTGYFWSYAIGELIVGHLSDRISPARFIAGGLLASGLINLLYPTIDAPWLLVVFWSLNGLAQACGWTSGLKVVALVLDSRGAARVASIYGTSFVVGTSISWGLAGFLVQNVSLTAAFVVPGLILTTLGSLWVLLGQSIGGSIEPTEEVAGHFPPAVSLRLFGTASSVGFAYVAFLVWTPTYFTDVHGFSAQEAGAAAALLPLISLVFMNRISAYQRRSNADRDLRGLTIVTAIAAGLLLVEAAAVNWFGLGILVFVAAIASLTASASLVLGHAPVVLAERNSTGRLAGRVGFSFSIGGGIGAFAVGLIRESSGWPAVFLCLGAVAVVATLVSTSLSRGRSEQPAVSVS